MEKKIIESPIEPNRNFLWLHRVGGILTLQEYRDTGWENIGLEGDDVYSTYLKYGGTNTEDQFKLKFKSIEDIDLGTGVLGSNKIGRWVNISNSLVSSGSTNIWTNNFVGSLLVNNTSLQTGLPNSSNFALSLIANSYFIERLVNDENFITKLKQKLGI